MKKEDKVGLVDMLSSRWVNEFNLPDGYIFKDENGNVINATKIVLEKKKKEYPKNYASCCGMTKMDIRLALCKHPNPKRIIDDFNDVYKWNIEERLFGNIVLFLEVVRQNNLWDRLEKLLEE